MQSSTLWPREPHTAAKHDLLSGYLGAWYPVLASNTGRVVFLDGFAGPGRYSDGEPGSPVVALTSLLDHSYFPKLNGCEFVFIFNEADYRRYQSLQDTIDAFKAANRPWPPNVKVVTNNGDFAELARDLALHGRRLAPTFAFLDPFGYKDLEMRTVAELLAADRCELFCYFDYNSANRFATSGIVDDRFEALFGSSDYRNAPPAGNPMRGKYLVDLFERQLQTIAGFTYTQSFAMRIKSGIISHYLVFATRSPTGLDKMKQVMWKMDPTGGYMFSDRFAGTDVLFTPEPDTRPLRQELAKRFRGRSVPIAELIGWVIAFTPYHSGHVKTATLRPMEIEGLLTASPRRRTRTYPDGCIVTFN